MFSYPLFVVFLVGLTDSCWFQASLCIQ